MQSETEGDIFKIYRLCFQLLAEKSRELETEFCRSDHSFDNFPAFLSSHLKSHELPLFLPDLARLELTVHRVGEAMVSSEDCDAYQLNPSLQIVDLPWANLSILFEKGVLDGGRVDPEPGEEIVLVWKNGDSDDVSCQVAKDEELLILKMIIEGLDSEDVASAGDIPVGAVDQALERAVSRGLVLAPGSLLRRDKLVFPDDCMVDRDRFLVAESFTLQWHLTQACDLHCRHCYDRSERETLSLDRAIRVLDDLRTFCHSRHVDGHVSFSGGNPLLYPHFKELYQAAVDRGLGVAILGNPASRQVIEELIEIRPPAFYQVSLEGMAEHNDYIRGKGHFERIMTFLDILKELEVYSMVMLTLSKDNMAQVIPLAEHLRNKVDSFTFNRLAMVGEGANLHSADPVEFQEFLGDYLAAARENSAMRLKDNLFNIIRFQSGERLYRGCAGFGCGAAFSFLTLLPEGEVHACRKFPSPVGNILEQSLSEIYDSETSGRYRQGIKSLSGMRDQTGLWGLPGGGFWYGD